MVFSGSKKRFSDFGFVTAVESGQTEFGSSLALGPSAEVLVTTPYSMTYIGGTDNVALAYSGLNPAKGIQAFNPACAELWEWVTGQASTRYSASGATLTTDADGRVYWTGRVNGTGFRNGVAAIDGATGIADWFTDINATSGIFNDPLQISLRDGQLWIAINSAGAVNAMRWNLDSGSEVSRLYLGYSLVSKSLAVANGLVILGGAPANSIVTWDPALLATGWSISFSNAAHVTTTRALSGGMNTIPSPDGNALYVTTGNNTTLLSAFSTVDGAELWEVDISALVGGAGGFIWGNGIAVDKFGDIYVLVRMSGQTFGSIVRLRPDGSVVYVSHLDRSMQIDVGGTGVGRYVSCISVSELSGIIFIGDTRNTLHTVIQS